ncbi:hypothetical protein GVAV_002014 [Gurleya vavrai]
MVFKKQFHKDKLNDESRAHPNQRDTALNENLPSRGNGWKSYSSYAKKEYSSSCATQDGKSLETRLRKGLSEREIRTIIYIVEGEDGFEEKKMRGKVSKLAQCGDANFRDWLIDRAAINELPKEWSDLKEKIVKWCLEEDVDSIKIYKDESYSDFLCRCRDAGILTSTQEKVVLNKIRKSLFR